MNNTNTNKTTLKCIKEELWHSARLKIIPTWDKAQNWMHPIFIQNLLEHESHEATLEAQLPSHLQVNALRRTTCHQRHALMVREWGHHLNTTWASTGTWSWMRPNRISKQWSSSHLWERLVDRVGVYSRPQPLTDTTPSKPCNQGRDVKRQEKNREQSHW